MEVGSDQHLRLWPAVPWCVQRRALGKALSSDCFGLGDGLFNKLGMIADGENLFGEEYLCGRMFPDV